jgi:hypothetical protein
MNKSTIDMAREAGFTWEPINNIIGPLKRFEQLVRADEREVCAKVCESLPMQQDVDVRDQAAAAIRNRGNA